MRLTALVSCLILIGLWGWTPPAAADAMDRLIRDATSAPLPVRQQALQALGNSGDLRALQPLLVALQDDNPTIRQCAKSALQTLARTLQSAYQVVAQWIESLIIALGGTPAPEPPVVEKTLGVRHL
jgi:HEAT repeat protein